MDRSNADARAKSVHQLKWVLQQGISVLIFPEGTFNMTTAPLQSFYDGAFKIAIETQTDIKPVLFVDMYNRMPYGKLFSITPGKSRAVFMEPVSVQGLTLDDLPALKTKVHTLMSDGLRAYNASWIKE